MELISQYDKLENDPDILFAMGGNKLPRTRQELKTIIKIELSSLLILLICWSAFTIEVFENSIG